MTNLHMKLSGAVLALIALTAATTSAQTIAITGGKVYPVSSAPIQNGTVLIRDGKIVAVGANVTIPADAQRVDATGKWVTRGLINSSTQLGLVEVAGGGNTREEVAHGRDNMSAACTLWEGLNTSSVLIAPPRREGVRNVVVTPANNHLVPGQAAMIRLVEGMRTDMVIRTPVAMVAQVQ